MPGQWVGSQRRDALPPGWAARTRPRILARDNHQCTWLGDVREDGRPAEYITAVNLGVAHQALNRCQARADDVDHIGDPEDHRDDNLRSLCSWHHDRRSSDQGNRSRAALRNLLRDRKKPHPGLL